MKKQEVLIVTNNPLVKEKIGKSYNIDFVDGDIRHSSKDITLSKNFKIQMVHPTYLIGIEDDVKEFSIRHQIPHIFINMDDFVNRLAQAINVMEKCNVVSEPY